MSRCGFHLINGFLSLVCRQRRTCRRRFLSRSTRCTTSRIFRQRSPLHLSGLTGTRQRRSRARCVVLCLGFLLSLFNDCLILGARVVVCHLNADFSGILALELQAVPLITLAASGNDQLAQVNPRLPDQICLLVVIEDRNFEPLIIRGLMHSESQLLIPRRKVSASEPAELCK